MKNKHPQQATFLNKWYQGNGEDGKHYWLTPHDLMEKLSEEFNFDFDPCPFPLPEGFDGLAVEWGESNYVNPPFGSIIHKGKKKGPTAWARKALFEYQKGKKVVLVYPIDKWILMLLKAGAEVRNLGDVKWLATEDDTPGKGTGRHIAMFVLDPEKIIKEEKPNGVYMIRFVIPGTPVSKARPRVVNKNGKTFAFTPKKSKDYEKLVKYYAHEVMLKRADLAPTQEAVYLAVVFRFLIPMSWSAKKKRLCMTGEIQKTSRPDSDNLLKGIKDGCNSIVWHDDSQVVETHTYKIYSHVAETEIFIATDREELYLLGIK